MTDLYLLDTGPLGLVTNPRDSPDARLCKEWLRATLSARVRVMIPEVADYELRRELIRAGKSQGLARLDSLAGQIGTLPVDLRTWHLAAEMWAESRNEGRATAAPAALDGDVILAAVAQVAAQGGATVIVVTGNVGHLARFCDAREWRALASDV